MSSEALLPIERVGSRIFEVTVCDLKLERMSKLVRGGARAGNADL